MPSGQMISYSNTQPKKRVVTDKILMADVADRVSLNALGLDNESKFNFVNTPGEIYEWLEDTYADLTDTANDTGIDSVSTDTTLTVTTGTQFQVGDVILLDSEYMLVTGVSTNDLTVTRGYAGTQATHVSNTTVTIVSRARIEGTASNDSNFTQATRTSNYSQIFHKEIDISRTDALLKRYGMADRVDYELDKAMVELVKLLDLSLFHAPQKAGTATTPRGMGRIKTFVTTNKNSLTGTPPLTRKHIDDELYDCWLAGGAPDLILTSAWAKRKMSDFYAGFVRTERSEKLGGFEITQLLSPIDGSVIDVLVDRNCPNDELYILDSRYVGLITIDPFFSEELGKVGDTAYFGQVVGEYGFVVAFEKAHSYIEDFSTSA